MLDGDDNIFGQNGHDKKRNLTLVTRQNVEIVDKLYFNDKIRCDKILLITEINYDLKCFISAGKHCHTFIVLSDRIQCQAYIK